MKASRYLPSPDEIRRACRNIRKTWSDREFLRRARHLRNNVWTVPLAPKPQFQFELTRD